MKRNIVPMMIAALAVCGCENSLRIDACGDGILGENEICDGTLFMSGLKAFCPNGDLADNVLVRCTAECKLDMSKACEDTSKRSVCGNGIVETGEECDGSLPAVVAGCDEPDFSKLSCEGCKVVDDGVCPKPDSVCGNGQIDDGELCDGDNVPSAARVCPENMVMVAKPYFRCMDSCQIVDVSQACMPGHTAVCGNGILDPGEQCDGTVFDESLAGAPNCGVSGKVYDASRFKCTDTCEVDASEVCVDAGYTGVIISELVPAVRDNELEGVAIEVANRGSDPVDMSTCSLALFSESKIEKLYGFSSLGLNTLGAKQVYVVCSQSGSGSFWGDACDFILTKDDIVSNLRQKVLLGVTCDATDADATATDGQKIVDLVNLNSFYQAIIQGGAVDFIRMCTTHPHTASNEAVLGDGWSISAYTDDAPEYDLGTHCSGDLVNGDISCRFSLSSHSLTSRKQTVDMALEIKVPGITDVTNRTDETTSMRVEFFSGSVDGSGNVTQSVNHYVRPDADTTWTNNDGYDRYIGTLHNWDTYEGFWSDETGTYVVDAGITFDNGATYTYCGTTGVLDKYGVYEESQREKLVVGYADGVCGNGVIDASETCDGDVFLEESVVCDKENEVVLLPSKVSCGSCNATYTATACGAPLPNCNGEAVDGGEVCDGSHIPDEAKVCETGETVVEDAQWVCGSTCAYVDKSKACEVACGNGKVDEKVEGQNAEICDGDSIPEAAKVCPKGMVTIASPVWTCNDTCGGIDETKACEKACGNGKLDASVSGQTSGEVCEGELFSETISQQCSAGRTYDESRKSCSSTCGLDLAACVPSQQLVFDEYIIATKPDSTSKAMALMLNLYGNSDLDVSGCTVSMLDTNGKVVYSKYTNSSGTSYMLARFSLLEIGADRIEGDDKTQLTLNPCKPLVICSIPTGDETTYRYFSETVFGGKCDVSLGLPESDTKSNGDFMISRMTDIHRIQLTCGGEFIDFVDYKGLSDAYQSGKTHGKIKESDKRPWSGSESVVHANRFDLDDSTISAETFATRTCTAGTDAE